MASTTISRAQLVIPRLDSFRQVWWRNVALLALSLPLLLFLLIPLVALVLRTSLDNLLTNLMDTEVAQAVSLSMVTTSITTLVSVVAGSPLAYLLARRKFWGHAVLDTWLDLPMVLPPSVAGVALLMAFGRRGLLGPYLQDANIEIAFTQTAVVLAQIFIASPFYIKTAISGFSGVDRELEMAAEIDGAGPFQVFRLITLPLSWNSLLSGAVMTWARALGEFGATIIFAGNFPGRTQTMPLAIYIGFEVQLNVALTLAVILLTLSFVVLFVVKGLLRQRVTYV